MKDPAPSPSPVPLPRPDVRKTPEPVQKRMDISEKGPFVQGAPKMHADDFRGQSVDKLQALATDHSQQHGLTPDGGTDELFVRMKDQSQEIDYERNT